MNITVDTNVLVRLIMADDEGQNVVATDTMRSAEAVAISVYALCELAWVLRRHYAVPRHKIADAIRRLVDIRNVVLDRPAVEAGLRVLDAGGDFADGVIAHDGRWLGGETFVSFDRQAVSIMVKQGQDARLPSASP